MQSVVREVGSHPSIVITSVGGDLRVSGRKGEQLEVIAPEKGMLSIEETAKGIEISCRSGCVLYVPVGAKIEAGEIGGDGRLTDVLGALLLRSIGGDCSLRRMGQVSMERIGGDAHIRDIGGSLMLDHVGGDAVIHAIEGDVRLRRVGGDLMMTGVRGSIEAAVGGDAVLNLMAAPGSLAHVQTGSDLACQLPANPSVVLRLQSGAQLQVQPAMGMDIQGQDHEATLGDGEAELDLKSGGDLSLACGPTPEPFDENIVGDILTEVDAKLAEMEARFSAMGAGLLGFDADRIGARVRRSVRQAQRQAERATRRVTDKHRLDEGKRFHLKFESDGGGPDLRFADFSQSPMDVSDEERLTILRMVEQGKISVDEAEELLKALEGER